MTYSCLIAGGQVVTATAGIYGCNSSIRWNPIAYIPVHNNLGMVKRVKEVAADLSSVKQFIELDRPTFVAEDVAFFNGMLLLALSAA